MTGERGLLRAMPVADVPDLVTAVRRAAAKWPQRTAWTFDPGVQVTFAEIESRTAAIAAWLSARGVGVGDRVAVMLANRVEYPLCWLALARVGAAMVPVNAHYRDADAGYVLSHSRAVLALSSTDLVDRVRRAATSAAVDIDVAMVEELPGADGSGPGEASDGPAFPEATVNIQYTSGTTGRPKGCVLSHRYWMELGGGLVTQFPHLSESDVMLTAQVFSYVDPQWNTVAALLSGARLVVLDGFHPSTFWGKVREHGVTYFYCLGAMPNLLLAMPEDAADRDHTVRVVQCSAIPPGRHAALESRWGVPWFEAFGMTETGGDLRVTDLDHDQLVGSGCLGRPVASKEVRVVSADGLPLPRGQVGEIVIRGPGLMDRYDDDAAATDQAFRAGWFHTGDLGRMDTSGRLYLAGRLKEMVRRGGENVAAGEVEAVLSEHPGVRLAAVVGVPDDLRGEEVKAFVVLSEPARSDAALADVFTQLSDHCGRNLARFKVPRFWEARAELPRTPSERVAKTDLTAAPGRTWDRIEASWR